MFTTSRSSVLTSTKHRSIISGRRLLVVDIENMVGGVADDPESVLWAQRQVDRLLRPGPRDQVVVGTCHRGLLTVGCTWPGKRYVVQSGPNGADMALLEVLAENLPGRFAEVVLISGDGIFASVVGELGGLGVKVVVVAHPDGLSRRLAMAASETVHLDERWSNPHTTDAA